MHAVYHAYRLGHCLWHHAYKYQCNKELEAYSKGRRINTWLKTRSLRTPIVFLAYSKSAIWTVPVWVGRPSQDRSATPSPDTRLLISRSSTPWGLRRYEF